MSISHFSITGVTKQDLIDTCTFLMTQFSDIESMALDSKKRILIFYENNDMGKPFPMKVTPVILAEIIQQFLEETPKAEFDKTLSGYEEDYDRAWELFTPDWYSDNHGIEDYDLAAVLACRPTTVEYGK